jgi:hypothetical protein
VLVSFSLYHLPQYEGIFVTINVVKATREYEKEIQSEGQLVRCSMLSLLFVYVLFIV